MLIPPYIPAIPLPYPVIPAPIFPEPIFFPAFHPACAPPFAPASAPFNAPLTPDVFPPNAAPSNPPAAKLAPAAASPKTLPKAPFNELSVFIPNTSFNIAGIPFVKNKNNATITINKIRVFVVSPNSISLNITLSADDKALINHKNKYKSK